MIKISRDDSEVCYHRTFYQIEFFDKANDLWARWSPPTGEREFTYDRAIEVYKDLPSRDNFRVVHIKQCREVIQ